MNDLIIELLKQNELWSSTETFERNEFIIKPGEIERRIYLIEDGALRVFLVTELEENTIRFGYKNTIMTSLPSFFDELPSLFYVQAIRKCKIRFLEKSDFVAFIQEEPARMTQYNLFLQSLVTQQIEREIDILTHSPIDRFNRVLKRSPQLLQEIPSKYVASYLRMTPETLSRIRKH